MWFVDVRIFLHIINEARKNIGLKALYDITVVVASFSRLALIWMTTQITLTQILLLMKRHLGTTNKDTVSHTWIFFLLTLVLSNNSLISCPFHYFPACYQVIFSSG